MSSPQQMVTHQRQLNEERLHIIIVGSRASKEYSSQIANS
jgi:hypothetical protein